MENTAPNALAADTGYHFITRWRVEATCEEVYRLLEDAEALAVWWPSVYLDVKERDRRSDRVFELYTKGWLPYTLRWQFEVSLKSFPRGFSLRAWGDFVGEGAWTFEQDGPYCNITYDWKIAAEKPLLKRLSWLLRGLFSANHHWAMRQGLKSLEIELRRRRGEHNLPQTPGPVFPHNWLNNKVLD